MVEEVIVNGISMVGQIDRKQALFIMTEEWTPFWLDQRYSIEDFDNRYLASGMADDSDKKDVEDEIMDCSNTYKE